MATPLREGLAVELLVAGDLDDRLGRERVDHADADAVEAAGGAVRLALELTARVEGGHDDFERGLARVFRVRVDRDAAAVVEDGQAVARLQRDLDAAGVAGDRLVHRIVDDLGGEVVERARVGAADVHAGAAADGLQAFEDLDRGGVVAFGRGGGGGGSEQVGHVQDSYKALIPRVPSGGPEVFHSYRRWRFAQSLRRMLMMRASRMRPSTERW